MSSTADCINLIKAENIATFDELITGNKTEWKRVSKFNYRNGTRRYFYLLNSALIATVDEVAGRMYTVVRPPMDWEVYMLMDLRPTDDFIQEDIHDLIDAHYNFVHREAAKGSEPQQYSFMIGKEEGEEYAWIFFSPHKNEGYDQHLGSSIDHLLPSWLSGNEEMECTYSNFSNTGASIEDIKKELTALGFDYSPETLNM